MFTVRPALPHDIPRLADLWYEKRVLQQEADPSARVLPLAREAWEAAARARLARPDERVLAAERQGAIAGYIVAAVTPDGAGAILDMALDAHRYYPGAGRALADAARAWLRERGIARARVDVPRLDPVGQAFWRAQGAKDEDHCLWIAC